MIKRYDHSPRCSATGVTTASILALIVAMAISVMFDVQPADASVKSAHARTTASSRV